jgi:hypothetical protein
MSKKPRRTVIGERKICIFCARRDAKISAEHIWPVWSHGLFGELPDSYHRVTTHLTGGRNVGEATKWERAGKAFTRTIRVACVDCNSGWMSNLENRVKPFLGPMMKGQWIALNADARSVVAKWIAMKVISFDSSDYIGPVKDIPRKHVYDQPIRSAMMERGEVPLNFYIWLASGGGPKWRCYLWQHSIPVSVAPQNLILPQPYKPKKPTKPNLQLTTFGIGDVVAHIIAATEPGILETLPLRYPSGLSRLWPLASEDLVWPAATKFGDAEIDLIAHIAQHQLIGNPGIGYVP